MRIRTPLLIAALASLLVTGVALATHQSNGLSSSVQGRGSWARADRAALVSAMASQSTAANSDVAVVKASLTPDGYTYWHGHPGPSVVIVTAGEITVLEPAPNGACQSRTYGVGDAFFHGTGNHDFRNEGSETAEFLITYFVTSWPPLTHTEDPGVC